MLKSLLFEGDLIMEKRIINEIFEVLNGKSNDKQSIESIFNELVNIDGFDPSLDESVDLCNGPIQNLLRSCVNNELSMIVGVYYELVKAHPMVRALNNGGKLKSVSDVQGMQSNLNDIKSLHDTLSSNYIRKKGNSLDEGFKKKESQFVQLLDSALNIADKATYLSAYKNKSGTLNRKYIKELRNSLISVLDSINSTADSLECLGRLSLIYTEKYNSMVDDYKKFYEIIIPAINDLESELNELKTIQQEEKSAEKNNSLHQGKVILPVENPEEKERVNLIACVNDLYERFQIECMRELRKEVSMMNRDAYNHLMDKIDKFLKSFPMPLANNISTGRAKEAFEQVNKLYDMFSKISYNTYNPSLPYGTRSFE